MSAAAETVIGESVLRVARRHLPDGSADGIWAVATDMLDNVEALSNAGRDAVLEDIYVTLFSSATDDAALRDD